MPVTLDRAQAIRIRARSAGLYSAPMKEAPALLAFARTWWHSPIGLVASVVLAAAISALFAAADLLTGLVFFVCLTIGTVFAWIWTTKRIPRNKKGKIGFAVAIACEEESIEKEVLADFVRGLQAQLKYSNSSDRFHFMAMPASIARKIIEPEDAYWLQRKSKCQFILFGRVRKRQIGDKPQRIIDLSGLVEHAPLKAPAQERLRKQFKELIPSRVSFDENISVVGLEVTSAWAHVVAKYIIGFATALSGRFDEADGLLVEAYRLASGARKGPPAYARIAAEVPTLRAAMRIAQAKQCYERWRDHGQDFGELESMEEHLNSAKALEAHPQAIALRALGAFLIRRSCHESRLALEQISLQGRDAIWHYNMGFLYAYEGNLAKADHHYRRGASLPMPPEKIAELETFMCGVLGEEPQRYHLHYSLGLLNRTLKGDARSAIRDFEAFLQCVPPSEYKKHQQNVRKWVEQLGSQSTTSIAPATQAEASVGEDGKPGSSSGSSRTPASRPRAATGR